MLKIIALLFLTGFSAYAQSSPGYQSHSFQYLTGVLTPSSTTSSTANAWNATNPPKFYSMSVTTTATGFIVALEGSLDNVNWSTISVTNTGVGVISNTSPTPMLYFRMRASTIAANTAVTGTAIGVP